MKEIVKEIRELADFATKKEASAKLLQFIKKQLLEISKKFNVKPEIDADWGQEGRVLTISMPFEVAALFNFVEEKKTMEI
jgi:hypothetical protein